MSDLFNNTNGKLLTREYLLRHLKQEEIFNLVFNLSIFPAPYDRITSPFREDTNPGCWFKYNDNNILLFIDYANGFNKQYLDCFTAVKDYYNLNNFIETYSFIYQNLIIKSNKKKLVIRETTDYEKDCTRDFKISIQTRAFTFSDVKYWSNYRINIKELEQDLVYSVNSYKLIGTKSGDYLFNNRDSLCYAYTDFKSHNLKLYLPHSNKRFLTNCNQNDIGGKNLDNYSHLIITKSYKDYRVIRNLGYNVIWFQNEGMFPKLSILQPYLKDKVYVMFDNDATGKIATNKLIGYLKDYDVVDVGLPDFLLEKYNIKDASDLVCKKSVKTLKDYLLNTIV